MHELSITKSILAVAERTARDRNINRIRRINLLLGKYSGVIPEYVDNCFALISPGTICEGAGIAYHEQPVRIRCRSCGGEPEPEPDTFTCPLCGSGNIEITHGFDVYVESIEAE